MLVERLARDAGLDHAIEILGMHGQHAGHVAEVDRDAAERRVDVAFQRRAGAERDHRHALRAANAHDVLHVRRALRKHHRIRRLVGQPGERIAVLFAHRLRGDDTIAEFRGERRDGGSDRFRIAAAAHRLSSGRRLTTLVTSDVTLGTSSSRNGIGRHKSITMMPSRAMR